MGQSADINASASEATLAGTTDSVFCALATACEAISTAMELPIQPRTGRSAIIKASIRNRISK